MVGSNPFLQVRGNQLQRRTVTAMNLDESTTAIDFQVIWWFAEQVIRPRERRKVRQAINLRPSA